LGQTGRVVAWNLEYITFLRGPHSAGHCVRRTKCPSDGIHPHWQSTKMTQSRVCSRGSRCRAIRLAQSLTDVNFRRPVGRGGFFKTCNLCRNTSVHIAPDNNPSTSQSRQPQYCSTCRLPRDSQYFRPGFPKATICTHCVWRRQSLCILPTRYSFTAKSTFPDSTSPTQPTQPVIRYKNANSTQIFTLCTKITSFPCSSTGSYNISTHCKLKFPSTFPYSVLSSNWEKKIPTPTSWFFRRIHSPLCTMRYG